MSSMDPTPEKDSRKSRIDELLLMIGGLEVSIRDAQELRDWEFLKVLQPMKAKYYEKLRRVSYGLPEENKLQAKAKS